MIEMWSMAVSIIVVLIPVTYEVGTRLFQRLRITEIRMERSSGLHLVIRNISGGPVRIDRIGLYSQGREFPVSPSSRDVATDGRMRPAPFLGPMEDLEVLIDPQGLRTLDGMLQDHTRAVNSRRIRLYGFLRMTYNLRYSFKIVIHSSGNVYWTNRWIAVEQIPGSGYADGGRIMNRPDRAVRNLCESYGLRRMIGNPDSNNPVQNMIGLVVFASIFATMTFQEYALPSAIVGNMMLLALSFCRIQSGRTYIMDFPKYFLASVALSLSYHVSMGEALDVQGLMVPPVYVILCISMITSYFGGGYLNYTVRLTDAERSSDPDPPHVPTVTREKTCPYCGHRFDADLSQFCPDCGKQLRTDAEGSGDLDR